MSNNCSTCRYVRKARRERDSHCFSCSFRRDGWRHIVSTSLFMPCSKVVLLKCKCLLSTKDMADVRNQMIEDRKHGYLIIPECFELIGFVEEKEQLTI